MHFLIVLLACKSVDRSTFCMKRWRVKAWTEAHFVWSAISLHTKCASFNAFTRQ